MLTDYQCPECGFHLHDDEWNVCSECIRKGIIMAQRSSDIQIRANHVTGKVRVQISDTEGRKNFYAELEDVPRLIEELQAARHAILECHPERA